MSTESLTRDMPHLGENRADKLRLPDEHPEGNEICRQVEYYFSDENLPSDAYLLGLCGGSQNLPVSVSRICGFAKMRKYKPMGQVKASLMKSTFLEFTDAKHIRRRVPLSLEPTVKSETVQAALLTDKKKLLSEKPWLTKAMVCHERVGRPKGSSPLKIKQLRPTGFEPNYADAPITPGEFEKERELYDPDLTFETRIENAVQRYYAKRKFHQNTLAVFNKFMDFGGIESGPNQFTGGFSKEDIEDKDAGEVAAIKAQHFVRQDVLDEAKWKVDFEGVAKGFLSSHMINHFDCGTEAQVTTITNIINNFYRYLLYHDVCPEYTDAINAAREICDTANAELPLVNQAMQRLPDGFSTACSTLHNGNFAGLSAGAQSWDGADDVGWSKEDAKAVLMAGIAAYGTDEQAEAANKAEAFDTVYQQDMDLEVVAVEMADNATRAFFEQARGEKTFLHTLGKLHCRRQVAQQSRQQGSEAEEPLVFWIVEDILCYCFVGMKIEANVRELDIGIKWLDSIKSVNASFYELLPNEFYDKNSSDGLPKEWYKRQRKIKEESEMADAVEAEAGEFQLGEDGGEEEVNLLACSTDPTPGQHLGEVDVVDCTPGPQEEGIVEEVVTV